MGFDFNPTLWFVCRFCKHLFVSAETLKEHKLACHLGECLQIKCIIFEESVLHEEWMPEHNLSVTQNWISSAKSENRNSLKECGNKVGFDSGPASESSFKNPYVSLIRITDQETRDKKSQKKSLEGNKKLKLRQFHSKSEAVDKELELSNQKLHRAHPGETSSGSWKIKESAVNEGHSHTSVSDHDILPEQEIQPKEESTQVYLVANEDTYFNLNKVKDRVLMVASVSQNTDDVPQIQFESTLIHASAQEAELLQKLPPTIPNPIANPDTVIVETKQQEMIIGIEANNSNSLSGDEFKMNSFEFDRIDTSHAVKVELERNTSESDQHQLPAATTTTVTTRTTTCAATGEAVAKPFMCETCFAVFRTKKSLTKHMVCHSSSKPFKCSMCPSKFKRTSELRHHEIVHGKETNFKCRFCYKSFNDNQNLGNHERTHTGDRPFKCPPIIANMQLQKIPP